MPPENLPSEYPQKLAAQPAHTIDAHIQNGLNPRKENRTRRTLLTVGLIALAFALTYLVYSYFFSNSFVFMGTSYRFQEEVGREGIVEHLYTPRSENSTAGTRIIIRNAAITVQASDVEEAKDELRKDFERLGFTIFYSHSLADSADTEENEQAAVVGYLASAQNRVALHRVRLEESGLVEVIYEKDFSAVNTEERAELMNAFMGAVNEIGPELAQFEFPEPPER